MALTSNTSNATLMANSIRALAMDAVQQANSGHPGAPMGMDGVRHEASLALGKALGRRGKGRSRHGMGVEEGACPQAARREIGRAHV